MIQRKSFAFLAAAGLILLLLFFSHPLLLRGLGHLVVYENSGFEKVDAVIILSGREPERVLQAADLLLQNRAGIALLTREKQTKDDLLLRKMGIDRFRSFEINHQVLIYKGISPERIEILPGIVDSTWDEALAFRSYLATHNIKSAVIVTSSFHSYRAHLNFERALDGLDVHLYSLPSKYSDFDPDTWWSRRDQAKTLYMELPSLAAFFLGFR
ncbi:MAG: YdcF family protein [Acidobacteriota bacterium]